MACAREHCTPRCTPKKTVRSHMAYVPPPPPMYTQAGDINRVGGPPVSSGIACFTDVAPIVHWYYIVHTTLYACTLSLQLRYIVYQISCRLHLFQVPISPGGPTASVSGPLYSPSYISIFFSAPLHTFLQCSSGARHVQRRTRTTAPETSMYPPILSPLNSSIIVMYTHTSFLCTWPPYTFHKLTPACALNCVQCSFFYFPLSQVT